MKRFLIVFVLVISLMIPVMMNNVSFADQPQIVIGLITALTGPTSLWGNQERNGAVLRVDEINAVGGVLGKQIKLVVYDHKGSTQEGVSAYRRLVDEDKAVVVLGTHFSNISLAIAPVAEQKKIPIIGQPMEPKATMPTPGTLNRYHFLAQPSCIEQGQMMARFGLEDLKGKTAAVLTDKSNSYSISQAEAFAEYFKARGGKIVSYIEYAAGTVDFKVYMTRIKQAKPELLYLPQYAQHGGMQVKQAREAGIKAKILGSNSLSDPTFMNAAGGAKNVEGVYFLFNVNFKEARFEKFIKDYEAKFGGTPVTYHCLFGYDDATLAVEAIKNAGSAEPEKIRTALENLKRVPILMGDGYFTIDPKTHRTVAMPSWVFEWRKNGDRAPVKMIYPAD